MHEFCIQFYLNHRGYTDSEKQGLLVSFDPNIRLQLWSREKAKETRRHITSMTDIILPGVLEAEIMVGTVDFKTVAQVFHDKGDMEGYPTRRKWDEYLREKPLS